MTIIPIPFRDSVLPEAAVIFGIASTMWVHSCAHHFFVEESGGKYVGDDGEVMCVCGTNWHCCEGNSRERPDI